MPKKRKNGQGTMRLRKDGYWEGRIFLGYKEDGSPRTKSVFAHTKFECQQKVDDLMLEMGYIKNKRKNEITVGEWIQYWYKTYIQLTIRPNTQVSYQNLINNHIIPKIGDIKLIELTQYDLQQFYINELENGNLKSDKNGCTELSIGTIKKCHILCKKALDRAIVDGYIYKNVATGCKLPTQNRNGKQLVTSEEIKRILSEAKKMGYYELFVLELSTGLRRGEILGLQWDDIDMKTGKLNISRQVTVVNGKKIITDLKTHKGNRSMILPDKIISILEDYKLTSNSKWLFPASQNNEDVMYPKTVNMALERILLKADCKHICFHDLRHTFATLLLANGVELKTLSEILGHSSIETTLNVYSHMLDEMQKEASEKIEKRFTEIKPAEPRKPQRKNGTGTITKITEDLYEGRYSPRNAYGKKISKKIYATSRDECEVLLAKLIEEMKAEISAEKERIKFEQSM